MNPIIFDIETEPRPLDEIKPFMPTEWPLGNIKDPEKIKAAVAEKEKNWIEDAALSAVTGRVVVIGVLGVSGHDFIHGNEAATISKFWDIASTTLYEGAKLVGFNCNTFDLPFLIRRSWHLGVAIPPAIRNGRYFNQDIIDLRETWQMGDKQCHGSLDVISKFLGGPGKNGNGKNFGELWKTNQPEAEKYLLNDLQETKRLYELMVG